MEKREVYNGYEEKYMVIVNSCNNGIDVECGGSL